MSRGLRQKEKSRLGEVPRWVRMVEINESERIK